MAKDNDKISKCSGLRVELAKIWNSECDAIPVVIGGLRCVSKNDDRYLLSSKDLSRIIHEVLHENHLSWKRNSFEIIPMNEITNS